MFVFVPNSTPAPEASGGATAAAPTTAALPPAPGATPVLAPPPMANQPLPPPVAYPAPHHVTPAACAVLPPPPPATAPATTIPGAPATIEVHGQTYVYVPNGGQGLTGLHPPGPPPAAGLASALAAGPPGQYLAPASMATGAPPSQQPFLPHGSQAPVPVPAPPGHTQPPQLLYYVPPPPTQLPSNYQAPTLLAPAVTGQNPQAVPHPQHIGANAATYNNNSTMNTSGAGNQPAQLQTQTSTTTSLHSSSVRSSMECKPPVPVPPVPIDATVRLPLPPPPPCPVDHESATLNPNVAKPQGHGHRHIHGHGLVMPPSSVVSVGGVGGGVHNPPRGPSQLTQYGGPTVAVGRGPVAQYTARPRRPQSDLCGSRGRIIPVAEALKDVLDKTIDEVDPKAVLRRSRTLRKKIRVAWYHLMRPPQDLTPTERVKASRLPEFEAALARLDETARQLGLLPATEEAVLQEGARLMLLAKEDLEAFWTTGPNDLSTTTDTAGAVAAESLTMPHRSLNKDDDDDDDDDVNSAVGEADIRAALFRKFVQSAAFHAVKMRRLHAQSAAGRSPLAQ